MGKFLRIVLPLLLCMAVLTGLTYAQKKADAFQRAADMMKNYKPPTVPATTVPTETPAQAWKNYKEPAKAPQAATRKSGTGTATTPTGDQYRSKGKNLQLQDRAKAFSATPKSEQEIRRQAADQIQQEIAKGRGPAYEYQKRGLTPPMTAEQMQQAASEKIKQLEASGKGPAYEMQRRGIPVPVSAAESERLKNEALQKNSTPAPPDMQKQLQQRLQADRAAGVNAFGPTRTTLTNYYGAITGSIYSDANHNSQYDAGETGLAGWKLLIHRNSTGSNVVDTVTTDSNGVWWFIDTLGVDYFYMEFVARTGYYQTPYPGWNTGWRYVNNDTTYNQNYGVFEVKPNILKGTVYNDPNHNGTIDTLEAGLQGWTMHIYSYSRGQWFQTTTDTNGNWSFADTIVGSYQIYEDIPKGYYQTGPSGNNRYINTNTLWGDTVTLNFGNWLLPPIMIDGYIFNDLNRNGSWDAGEPPLAGRTVQAQRYYSGGTVQAVTDTNGYYAIRDTGYADYYTVRLSSIKGWYNNPNSYYQHYYLGDTTHNNNFGSWLIPPTLIDGYKYSDINHNGTWDPGEPGVAGWTIRASRYYAGGTLETVTDSTGYYAFRDTGYVDYYTVYEVNREGWLPINPVDGGSYRPYIFADSALGLNFGNWDVPPSALHGTVFNDINANGQRDDGEPAIQGVQIVMYDEYHGKTDTAITDQDGHYRFDSLTWMSYYRVSEVIPDGYVKTYPLGDYWRPYLAADTVEFIDFGNYQQGAIRVNTMPSNAVSVTYANGIASQPLAVWGNVHGGTSPLTYVLDYGDGTIDSGTVADRHYIGTNHTYETAGPKQMSLKVTDADGNADSSTSQIRIFAVPTKQIRVNMAIEKGLLYNYLNQYPAGHWAGDVASTGAALLTFEENGHKPFNSYKSDIYAEYVRLGLDWLTSGATRVSISPQPAGDPDANHNGYGVYLNNNTYTNGIGMLAIIGAYPNATAAQKAIVTTGPYAGVSMYEFGQDAMDQWAFSQTDNGGGEGGWRYGVSSANSGDQDNSTTQWAALNLEAGENSWGLTVPSWVKTELLKTLLYTQNANGGFGYQYNTQWLNITKTAAGIGSYAFLGYTTDSSAIQNAIGFINNQWNLTGTDDNGWAQHLSGNMYAMYGVAKGMRIINHRAGNQFIGAHDWYEEYATHLLDDNGYKQNADGSWPRSGYYPTGAMSDPLNSSLAILILTRGVVTPPPVAIIQPLGKIPPNTPFTLDGSASFHQDPAKSIIEWDWDFNSADGLDWNHIDASGQKPTNPGYPNEGTYTVTLRVKDNSDPPMYSITTANVVVSLGHHPPVAVAIPPDRGSSYSAKVGEPMLLDGRSSYSPDYPADSVVAYSWDLNGDGIFGDATTDTVTVVFNNEHQGQVGLRVYDTHGDSSSNVAYITIVASRRNLFVKQFVVRPTTVYTNGTLDIYAIYKNDPTSNTGSKNVLVRFYDDNPLTVGNRLGGDVYVDLPIGAEDTVRTTITLPPRMLPGKYHIFTYLDANDQQAEWDKTDNLNFVDITVVYPPAHIELRKVCLNYGTVKQGDSTQQALPIGNSGQGPLFIDSMTISSPDFVIDQPDSMYLGPGQHMVLRVYCKPQTEGVVVGALQLYTNDGQHTIGLFGHGEMTPTGNGKDSLGGIVTIDGQPAPDSSVVDLVNKRNGKVIFSRLVHNNPPSAFRTVHEGTDYNYEMPVLEGQGDLKKGDTLIFRVRAHDCQVLRQREHGITDSATIFDPQDPGPSTFRTVNIDAVHPATITIPLRSGYNAISWNVIPDDQTIPGVFGDLLNGKVRLVLSFVGDSAQGGPKYDYYIPALGAYNPITTTDYRRGYFVGMRQDLGPESLAVTGLPLTGVPLFLNNGYNLVSYLPATKDSTWHAVASLPEGSLEAAYDYLNDGVNSPSFANYPGGDFTVMQPGRGYFLKVAQPNMLLYPYNESVIPAATRPLPAKAGHTVFAGHASPRIMNDGASLPVAIFAYGTAVRIHGDLVPAGSTIKAVDASGTICGSGKFVANGIFSMAIYGDNPATEKREGPKPGEMVKIFINDQMIAQQVRWTEFGDTPEISGAQSVTGVLLHDMLPQVFALHQNYPNPFNPSTSIRYDLPKASTVVIKIYDMLGREVRALEQADRQAGYYEVMWDGKNNDGLNVASGIYTYRLTATATGTTFVDTHKMIMIK